MGTEDVHRVMDVVVGEQENVWDVTGLRRVLLVAELDDWKLKLLEIQWELDGVKI